MPYAKVMFFNLLIIASAAVLIKFTKAGVPELKRYKENPFGQTAIGIVIFLICLGCNALRSGFTGEVLTVFAFAQYSFKEAIKFLVRYFCVGVGEELLFRCWLQKFIERVSGSEWVGLAVATLVFGLSHCIFGFWFEHLVYTSVVGLVFGIAFIKWKGCTIYSLMIAHFLYDMTVAT